jgi:hypothetical protein
VGLIRISRWTSTRRGREGLVGEMGRRGLSFHPFPIPASPRLSMSGFGPNYSRLVPHYCSQLLISASEGSLPAVIAKDRPCARSRLPGPRWEEACTPAGAHARAHTRTLDTRAICRLPPGSSRGGRLAGLYEGGRRAARRLLRSAARLYPSRPQGPVPETSPL